MSPKPVLICCGESKVRGQLTEQLANKSLPSTIAATPSEALQCIDAQNFSVAVVDVVSFRDALWVLDAALSVLPAIALADINDLAVMSALICDGGVTHVMPRPAPGRAPDLALTVGKLLKRDIFGLDKYLPGGADIIDTRITHAGARDSCVSEIADFLREHKAPRRLLSTIANAADEMLTNAIYNAPVDVDGHARYESTDRKSKIVLLPPEHVLIQYGCHDGYFAICVRDNFGRLTLEHLQSSVQRCARAEDQIEQKAGGAGLGLFMIARSAQQFVVNREANRRTEIIGVWDIDRRRIQTSGITHSLHYFEKKSHAHHGIQPPGLSHSHA